MSKDTRRINAFFKNAVKSEVEQVVDGIILSERQEKIFNMFYIKKQDIGYIADSLNVCQTVVNTELSSIRQKILRLL